ncbi:MAG: bifunctional diaminohydroxyphosphoribosylaminopyrimidine deaminase/5-amino-6-(5-phosphoribosylamino)uracil reductase RibD [Alphaproteobacteria bacterium]
MNDFSKNDYYFMQLALKRADRMLGLVAPNPAVGCVLVKDKRVIGSGATMKTGRPHAETTAIDHAIGLYGRDHLKGATAYITLEPCNHQGQTPPCTRALIDAGIKTVIIAALDPDPRVNGSGMEALKAAGIETHFGLMESEASDINQGFLKAKLQSKPMVSLKIATSLDGKLALNNGKSQWITNLQARQHGHFLRARHDALLIGAGTLRADDPQLNCRLPGLESSSPIPVILQGKMPLPPAATLLESNPNTIILYPSKHDYCDLYPDHVEKIAIDDYEDHALSLDAVLAALAGKGITRLLVESGQKLTTSFIQSKLTDYLYHYVSPRAIGNDGLPAIGELGLEGLNQCPHFHKSDQLSFDQDWVNIYKRIDDDFYG